MVVMFYVGNLKKERIIQLIKLWTLRCAEILRRQKKHHKIQTKGKYKTCMWMNWQPKTRRKYCAGEFKIFKPTNREGSLEKPQIMKTGNISNQKHITISAMKDHNL